MRHKSFDVEDGGGDTEDEEVQLKADEDNGGGRRSDKATATAFDSDSDSGDEGGIFLSLPGIDSDERRLSTFEDIPCEDGDFMSMAEFLEAFRNDFDLSRLSEATTQTQSTRVRHRASLTAASASASAAAEESESETYPSVSSAAADPGSATLDDHVTDYSVASSQLDDFYLEMSRHPGIAPVIRMIEMDGVSGTVGVLCPDAGAAATLVQLFTFHVRGFAVLKSYGVFRRTASSGLSSWRAGAATTTPRRYPRSPTWRPTTASAPAPPTPPPQRTSPCRTWSRTARRRSSITRTRRSRSYSSSTTGGARPRRQTWACPRLRRKMRQPLL